MCSLNRIKSVFHMLKKSNLSEMLHTSVATWFHILLSTFPTLIQSWNCYRTYASYIRRRSWATLRVAVESSLQSTLTKLSYFSVAYRNGSTHSLVPGNESIVVFFMSIIYTSSYPLQIFWIFFRRLFACSNRKIPYNLWRPDLYRQSYRMFTVLFC